MIQAIKLLHLDVKNANNIIIQILSQLQKNIMHQELMISSVGNAQIIALGVQLLIQNWGLLNVSKINALTDIDSILIQRPKLAAVFHAGKTWLDVVIPTLMHLQMMRK